MHSSRTCCLTLVAAAVFGRLATDPLSPNPSSIQCHFAHAPIEVDGRIDDAAWQSALLLESFTIPGASAPPPRPATRTRMLWDHEYLYLCSEMDDGDLRGGAADGAQAVPGDALELSLKAAAGGSGHYRFHFDVGGSVTTQFMLPARSSHTQAEPAALFHVDAKIARSGSLDESGDRDGGWSVEARIPWRDLVHAGARPEPGELMSFALRRVDRSVGDAIKISTIVPPGSKQLDDSVSEPPFGTVQFAGADFANVAGANAIARLRETWSTVPSRVIGSPDPPLPYHAVRALPKLKLSFPISVTRQPGTRRLLFIDQKVPYGTARLCRTGDDPESGQFDVLLEFPKDEVAYSVEFHPKFLENGYVFIGSNGPGPAKEKVCRVTRYRLDPDPPHAFHADSACHIIEWESNGHNGAAVAFGTDGMLYITSGDGTSDSDTNVTGQGLDHLLSKVLRIDVDRPGDGMAYSVPPDNPFLATPNVRPETWAYGFRNPWRMSIDPRTGHVWVGNNGQDLWEQIYLVERGANYGWSVYEGSHLFYPNRKLGPTPVSKPIFEHPHSEARSMTGGVVYYGSKLPELHGAYIYGDYSTGKIWGAKLEGNQVVWHRELADSTIQITAFGLDADGELLIADHRAGDGGFYTLAHTPPSRAGDAPFPRTLSETGLFESVPGHRVHPGLIPYTVNSPLWSDGAIKERFLYLPAAAASADSPDASRIEVTGTRGWNFPDGTVAVKSFALETEPGVAASRRWIETRLLAKQQGEWVGYSYRWNEQQTEAELVAAEGADRDFEVTTPGGPARPRTWHYPSRTECMVCHSRAANFVLGLTTVQLNRSNEYGAQSTNQLRLLESLGVLRVNWLSEADSAVRAELKSLGKSDDEIQLAMKPWRALSEKRSRPSTLLAQSPERLPRLVDPYDGSHDIELRARSYLHANCSQCHVEAGGGNAAIQLEFNTPLDRMKLIDEVPLHHKFNIDDARLVAPGDPDRSVLLRRVARRGQGQMPQLATALVDEQAVELLRQWIAQLNKLDALQQSKE